MQEIEKTSEVIVRNYQTIQAESFGYLKTNSNDWKMCKITGAHEDGAKFGVPTGYNQVHAWTVTNKFDESMSSIGYQPCELCGHPIKNLYPIQCDRLNIYMYVGSECVNNFHGAGYTHKMIVEYKETTLMKIFKAWRGLAIEEAFTNPKNFELHWKTKEPYARNGQMVIRHEVWQFQNRLSRLEDFDRIYTDDQKEKIKANPWSPKKDINELTSRKIANIFKKAKEFGFQIPETIEPLILPTKKLEDEK